MIVSRKLTVLTVLLTLQYSILIAQSDFDINEYLAGSTSANEIESIRSQYDHLSQANFKSPFLREVEFRLRTPDVQTPPNDFRLRFSPVNPYERKYNKEYIDVKKELYQSEQLVNFTEVLERRYLLIIQRFQLSEAEKLEIMESSKYQNLIQAYRYNKDASLELIKLDKRHLNNELNLEEIYADIRAIEYLIGSEFSFNGTISFEEFNFVTVDQIEEELALSGSSNDENDKNDDNHNIYIVNKQNRIKETESEFKIEKGEAFRNIGYLQAEYRSTRGESFDDRLGFQLAFQLPIVNPDRPQLERRKLRVIEDQNEIQEVRKEVSDQQFYYMNNLKLLSSQYHKIDQKLKSLRGFDLSKPLGIDAILEIEDYRSDLENQKLSIFKDILSDYIQLLAVNGTLSQSPIVNYLSAERTPIEADLELN